MKIGLRKRGPAFVKMYNRLLRDPSLSVGSKGMLAILKTYANADGSKCYPSVERLAGCAGISISSAKRLLKELKDRGVISVFPRLCRTDNNRYALEDCYFATSNAQPFRQSTGEPSPTAHRRTVTKNHGTNCAAEDSPEYGKIVPMKKTA